MLPVLEATVEGSSPYEVVHHPSGSFHARRDEARDLEEWGAGLGVARVVNRLHRAFVPSDGVSHREDDFRLGVFVHEFPVERACRPVNGRLVVSEDFPPFHGLAPRGPLPENSVRRIFEEFGHMVARAEAKPFEGGLQRHRACAAEARAYDFHGATSIARS